MLKQPMIEKLAAMRLLGMAEALKVQEQDPSARELSFLERFGLLVDQQWNWRENQALSRRLKNAELRTPNACVEEIDYRTTRGLDKSVIHSLTQQSSWVGMHENIFVLGPTGVGKSFVACALAQKACRDGYSALYTRAQSLFRDLAMARADGSLRSLLSRLSRIDVLVIDDWAMAPLSEPERRFRLARNSPGVVQRERRFWRTSQSMTTGCCWPLLPVRPPRDGAFFVRSPAGVNGATLQENAPEASCRLVFRCDVSPIFSVPRPS